MHDDWDLGKLAAGIYPAELVYYEEVGSTNDEALRLCRQWPDSRGLLVLAKYQSRGRGRGSHGWWSAEGALTFSWVPPATCIGPDDLALLPLAAGLSMVATLEQRFPRAGWGVKWPNDVLVNGRKIAGILVELSVQPMLRTVIGIGVNVNNSLTDAPADVRLRATSCREVFGETVPRVPLLLDILAALDIQLQQVRNHRDDFLASWRSYCLLAGSYVEVQVGRERVAGQCQGIDDNGALCVYTAQGCRRLSTGTVIRAARLDEDYFGGRAG